MSNLRKTTETTNKHFNEEETITLNTKINKKNEETIKRTGMIAAGAVAAAGLMLGGGAVSANAAELDASATAASLTATAEHLDPSAQQELDRAERAVEEAEAKVQNANDSVVKANENCQNAEAAVKEAQENCGVTEEDIAGKEKEVAAAGNEMDQAAKEQDVATASLSSAEADLAKKEGQKEEAEKALEEAEKTKAEEDTAVSVSTDAVRKAEADLHIAEQLKNGTLDIMETDQYKELQAAKSALEKAQEGVQAANEAVQQAQESLGFAERSVQNETGSLDAATRNLEATESAYQEAENTKAQIGQDQQNAQRERDAAKEAVSKAEADMTAAEKAAKGAKEVVERALVEKAENDSAVKKLEEDMESARADAEASVDSQIQEAESLVSDAQTIFEQAKSVLEHVNEKYKQGTLGLIEWMLEKADLTKVQKQDLQAAKDVLLNASEEDFSKWVGGNNTGLPAERNGKVVVIGDEKDATNLENLLKSIEIMKNINQLRANDDNYTGSLKRNDSYTNFFFMATAEAGAMRGAGLGRHSSLTTSCENLAFGYDDPNLGWYNKEKTAFDQIKKDLGITKITNTDEIKQIEKEADARGIVIGHYTNLFWAVDQVMGVGYTGYRATSCYNASKASNYTNDKYNRGMHIYTIDEFEKLVLEYYHSVDKNTCEEAFQSAESSLLSAQNHLKTLQEGWENQIAAAVQSAITQLEEKQKAATQAADQLKEAEDALSESNQRLETVKSQKAILEKALEKAETALGLVSDAYNVAEASLNAANAKKEEALKTVEHARAAVADAVSAREEVKGILDQRKSELSEAQNELDVALKNNADAQSRLEDLASDSTVNKLKEKVQTSQLALKDAVEKQAEAGRNVVTANEQYQKAKGAVAAAELAVREAEQSLDEAKTACLEIRGKYQKATDELDAVKEQYRPVSEALSAYNAAKEEVRKAEAILKFEQENLAKVKAELETVRASILQKSILAKENGYTAKTDQKTTTVRFAVAATDLILDHKQTAVFPTAVVSPETWKSPTSEVVSDLPEQKTPTSTPNTPLIVAQTQNEEKSNHLWAILAGAFGGSGLLAAIAAVIGRRKKSGHKE